ncbi:MAG: hypothetical protein KDB94_04235 [Acidobacteria bacterium]|nr:hypothetical protein [Acidobacteriota bacterium]
MSRIRPSSVLALAVAVAGWVAAPLLAAPGRLSPERLSWREISFQGSKFGISLRADLKLEPISAAGVEQELLPSRRGAGIAPAEAGALALALGSEVLDRRSDIRLLVDPDSGAALQRVQTDSGRKRRIKSLRYGELGISTVRTRPAAGEVDLPSERWTDVREGGDDYPPLPEGGLRVSDPTALFYVVAASDVARPGDSVGVPIFSDDRLLLVEAKVLELRRVEVDYELGDGTAWRRVRGPTTALRLSLEAHVVGGDGDGGTGDASFELAGLRGDVEMLLDPVSRIPLELSGRVPYAGRVAIRLGRAVERSEPAAANAAQRPAARSETSRR